MFTTKFAFLRQLVVIRNYYLFWSFPPWYWWLFLPFAVIKSTLAVATRCPVITVFHHVLFHFSFSCVINPLLALLAVKHLPQSTFLDRESAVKVILLLDTRRTLQLFSLSQFPRLPVRLITHLALDRRIHHVAQLQGVTGHICRPQSTRRYERGLPLYFGRIVASGDPGGLAALVTRSLY